MKASCPKLSAIFWRLLGWTPPESASEAAATEILGDQQLIRLFDLDGISHSNAVFDRAKLDWFNTEYIRAYPAEKLLPLIQEEWHKAGLEPAHTDPRLAACHHQPAQAAGPQPEGFCHIVPRLLHRHVPAGSRGGRKIPGR